MNPREIELSQKAMWPLIFKFSIPAIIGMLVNALYNIVDRFYIARIPDVGADALSALGITFPIINTGLAFALLLGIGSAANISIHLGKKDYKGAEQVLGNTFTAAIAISILLAFFCITFADKILMLFGGSADTIEYASPYLKIYFLGTIFFVTGIAMNHSVRGSGNPLASAMTQVVGAVLNTILDPIFIFVFKMGVEGAAIATVISQFASFLFVLRFVFSKKSHLVIKREHLKPRLSILTRIFAIGMSPFSLQVAASAVAIVANHSLKAYGGDDAIGAMTIITSVSMLFLMPIFGLNQGLQPILGYNYGAKNFARVRQALKSQVIIATGYVLVCFLAVVLFPSHLVEFFIPKSSSSSNLISIATKGLPIFFLALPILGFQIPVTNYYQSVGKALVSIIVTLLRQVILLIPLYLLLPHFFGLFGIWFAAPIADFSSFVITAVILIFEWRRLNELDSPLAVSQPQQISE